MSTTVPNMYPRFCAYGFLKNLQFFDPFLIFFFRENGLGFLEIGLLFSIREIANNLFEIPSGLIADAMGRKRAMVLSFLAYIVSFVGFTFSGNFALFAVSMLFFAGGEAFRSGTHKAMIMEYLKRTGQQDKKADFYGGTRSWAEIGSSLSALIAMAIAFWTGSYQLVFLFSAIPYVLDLLLILSYPSWLDYSSNEKGEVHVPSVKDVFKEMFAALRLKDLRRGLLSSTLYDALFKSVKDYLQPVLRAWALALPLIFALEGEQRVAVITGLVYFFLYILNAFASSRAAGFKRKVGDAAVAGNIMYLVGISLVVLSGIGHFLHFEIPVIVLFLLYYAVMNLRRPVMLEYVSDRLPEGAMTTGLSLETQLKTIFTAILAPVVGLLADLLGPGQALAIVGGFVFILYPLARLRKAPASV